MSLLCLQHRTACIDLMNTQAVLGKVPPNCLESSSINAEMQQTSELIKGANFCAVR